MPDDELKPPPGLEPHVDLVLLRPAENGLVAPYHGRTAFDPDDPVEPTGALLEELLESTVRILAADDVPVAVIDVLERLRIPFSFLTSPWLRQSRPIVLTDDAFVFGGISLWYTPSGLFVGEVEPTDD